jgi:AraC-like DNA-binding protein
MQLASTIDSRARTNNRRPSTFHAFSSTAVDAMAGASHTAAMPDPWKTSPDPLGEALHFLRMSGSFYCLSEFTAPWALDLPPMQDCVMFHVVTSGECRLDVAGAETCTLRPGALALVPHGRGHVLSSAQGVAAAKLFDLPREFVGDRYEHLRHGAGGTATTMLCAAVRFDDPSAHLLLRLLPRIITVDAWNSPELEWLQSTLRFLTHEARELRAGGETVITRLADILVIQAIRSWIATEGQAQTGWLRALRDKQIGRAIALIHRDPARDWTLASLASAVGMSRSALAARFTELVGEPAMQYLLRWKMHAALRWLRESDAPLSQLASRLGYDSEAAFSRAFKRLIGMSPGAARRAGTADRDSRS